MIIIDVGSIGLIPLPAGFRFDSAFRNSGPWPVFLPSVVGYRNGKSQSDIGNPDSFCKLAERLKDSRLLAKYPRNSRIVATGSIGFVIVIYSRRRRASLLR
jgi:hypothetical protein